MCKSDEIRAKAADLVTTANVTEQENLDDLLLNELTARSTKEWILPMQLEGTKMKVDTGAEINLLLQKYYRLIKSPPPIMKTTATVCGYTNKTILIMGKCELKMKWGEDDIKMPFLTRSLDNRIPILGWEACIRAVKSPCLRGNLRF